METALWIIAIALGTPFVLGLISLVILVIVAFVNPPLFYALTKRR